MSEFLFFGFLVSSVVFVYSAASRLERILSSLNSRIQALEANRDSGMEHTEHTHERRI